MSSIAITRKPTIARRLRKRIAELRRRWTPIRRYVIRHNYEWAIIHIDERYGTFSCQSTFGNYAHSWRSIGDRTLKEFLCGLNFDYFMGKTRPSFKRFDAERTIEGIKTHIIEGRRDGSLTKEEARDAWQDIESLTWESADAFFAEFTSSRPLMEVYGNDYSDIARETPDGDSRGFWGVIWPKFVEQLGGKAKPGPQR